MISTRISQPKIIPIELRTPNKPDNVIQRSHDKRQVLETTF